MIAAAIALAVLAVLLAWPVPIALARAGWPSRAPATALALWQAIALAGGLSMIGALLTFGLAPFGLNLVDASIAAVTDAAWPPAISNLLALVVAGLLAAYLIANLLRTALLIERQRRRHRQLVRLLSTPLPDHPNTRMIDVELPVAYCLPGSPHPITVFSAGLVQLLDDVQLRAVIEHEKAHLLQRHYIVLMAFDAWHRSLPWFPTATRARTEVALLIEMLADDHARRAVDDRTLAGAIALVASGAAGGATRGSATGARGMASRTDADLASHHAHQQRARVTRLIDVAPGLPRPLQGLVLAGAFGLVAVPTVLLLTPALGG
ncbi:Zn-dependent protease with chaperone function [Marisediminicola sp. UYEF4]|uniref:M56 family metallopeptidase n=1 Tax=Marisediminicola sp. UYEF4 TaxID=1756384 RepID=UPI003395D241